MRTEWILPAVALAAVLIVVIGVKLLAQSGAGTSHANVVENSTSDLNAANTNQIVSPQNGNQNTNTTSVDDTRTYTGDGFSVHYPSTWTVASSHLTPTGATFYLEGN